MLLFRQTLESGPKSYGFVQFFNNQWTILFGFLQRQIDCDDPEFLTNKVQICIFSCTWLLADCEPLFFYWIVTHLYSFKDQCGSDTDAQIFNYFVVK